MLRSSVRPDAIEKRLARGVVGLRLERLPHRPRDRVVQVRGLHPQDQLDRADHRHLVVVRRDHGVVPRVGRDGERGDAVALHVVGAVLRVVLHHEDRGVRPDLRVADLVHELADRLVGVAHQRVRRARSLTGARRVVVREQQLVVARHLAATRVGRRGAVARRELRLEALAEVIHARHLRGRVELSARRPATRRASPGTGRGRASRAG